MIIFKMFSNSNLFFVDLCANKDYIGATAVSVATAGLDDLLGWLQNFVYPLVIHTPQHINTGPGLNIEELMFK